MGSGFSGAATKATIMEVVTDELCMMLVARMPMRSPIKGFSVVVKKESRTSFPSILKPSPSPLTPMRKMKRRPRTAAARKRG
jgi:hypothetical protein